MRCLRPAVLLALCIQQNLAQIIERTGPSHERKALNIHGMLVNIHKGMWDDDYGDYDMTGMIPGTRQNGNNNVKWPLDMLLLWEDELEQVAAALLRAKLIACDCLLNDVTLMSLEEKERLGVHLPITVEVQLKAQWRVRLTPRADASPLCKNASSWLFYKDGKALRECDFVDNALTISSSYLPERTSPEYTTAYIVNDWEHIQAAEQLEQLAASSTARLNFAHIYRDNLKQLLHDSNRSFLFLEGNHWSNYLGVRLVQLPPCASCAASVETHEKIMSLKYDADLPQEIQDVFNMFLSSPSALRKVTEIAVNNKVPVEEAACILGQQTRKGFKQSRNVTTTVRIAAVFICSTEARDLEEYINLMRILADTSTWSFGKIILQIQVYTIDCDDTALLLRKLIKWFRFNAVSQIVGVILTNDMANAALQYAEIFKLPLLTYDVSSGSHMVNGDGLVVHSATGNLTHLELGLRRLLADCKWRRLAVISDRTRLATALTAALRNSNAGLTVRELSLNTTRNVHYELKKLVKANTRVFLVNTDATMAADVLAAAMELNITRNAGYTWIVREYKAADHATAVIKPYSVSFWWRGNVANKADKMIKTNIQGKTGQDGKSDVDDEFKVSNETFLRKQLEMRWSGRAWPLHAVSIIDALVTLREGIDQLNSYENRFSYSHRDSALRIFWNGVKRANISSINQKLAYDDNGIKAPLVFVQQWGAEPQPQVLATWRAGQWREDAETCPDTDASPDDGSLSCLIPVGDPFQPSCRDITWIASAALVAIVSIALITLAIKQSLQALSARDQRVKTEFAKRMLARRERVFAALAEHLVDRSALEMKQQLGTGRFGVVRLGLLRVSGNGHRTIVVASKALREDAAPAEESEFLREACTLAALKHDNIVRFVGVCVVDGPPLLLMEHAFFGDLLWYLQERRYLLEGATSAVTGPDGVRMEEKAYVSAEALTKLAQEAAAALAYIAQHGIVHRDVRASNCLVDERRSLKLADFGLARPIGTVDGEYACHRRGVFPVLWMAPESLTTGVSSTASDVWSFGVLVFELVTLGLRPYGSQPPQTVLRHVVSGGRPQVPWDASAETRALMRACWRSAADARPTAARLAEWLSERRRALRPALAPELVEIDSQLNDKVESIEFDLNLPAATQR